MGWYNLPSHCSFNIDYHSIIIFILWSGHLFAQKNLIYAMSSAFFGQFLHGSWSLLLGIPAVFLIEQV